MHCLKTTYSPCYHQNHLMVTCAFLPEGEMASTEGFYREGMLF